MMTSPDQELLDKIAAEAEQVEAEFVRTPRHIRL